MSAAFVSGLFSPRAPRASEARGAWRRPCSPAPPRPPALYRTFIGVTDPPKVCAPAGLQACSAGLPRAEPSGIRTRHSKRLSDAALLRGGSGSSCLARLALPSARLSLADRQPSRTHPRIANLSLLNVAMPSDGCELPGLLCLPCRRPPCRPCSLRRPREGHDHLILVTPLIPSSSHSHASCTCVFVCMCVIFWSHLTPRCSARRLCDKCGTGWALSGLCVNLVVSCFAGRAGMLSVFIHPFIR